MYYLNRCGGNLMKNVIFLGAGASKADGAPLQGELFKEYFDMRLTKNKESCLGVYGLFEAGEEAITMEIKVEKKVKKFFNDIFGINENCNDFPTFEEALGMLDLAMSRKEYFYNETRCHNLDSVETDSYQSYKLALVLSMAELIEYKLRQSEGNYHNKLVENFYRDNNLNTITFVSTNYDILIDNAILKAGHSIDYGFNRKSNINKVKLLKIHGSLNWLYCPVCKKIQVTPLEKGALRLLDNLNKAICNNCCSLTEAIIIPPTFFKDYNNFYLSSVWNQVEDQFTSAENIIFCGYSFPDADIYIKYLLKRGEINGKKDINIHIVNFFENKSPEQCLEEKRRYQRFFRNKEKVNYTSMSFEDFVSNPFELIK
jgi:NAD-dependent SIR2 family protein deacetylase